MNLGYATGVFVVFFLTSLPGANGQLSRLQTNIVVTNKSLKANDNSASNKKFPLPAPKVGVENQKSLVVQLDDATLAQIKSRPEPLWKICLPFLSTLLGAVIAFFGSKYATIHSHNLQVVRKKQEDAQFVERLEAAIATEIDLLGKFYGDGIGKDLAKLNKEEPLRMHFMMTERWFTVFEANANHLGKMEERTSQSIIKIYGLVKSLVEHYRINNVLLDLLESLEKQAKAVNVLDHADIHARHRALITNMIQLAGMLKDLEANLKREVEQFHIIRKSQQR